jgi:4-hydroxy-3-methylbut-2-enyl diphosphate reductase
VDARKAWERLMASAGKGELFEGKVVRAVNGGVLMDVTGSTVFVPASQSTVPREGNLESIVGQRLPVVILEVRDGRKAVGSIRQAIKAGRALAEEKVWDTLAIGNVYTGKVKSLTNFGAFVDIGGVDGLVHVSELSWTRVKHPSDVLAVGDTVEVTIKALDPEKHKISLGYRRESENPWAVLREKYAVGDVVNVKIVSFAPYGVFANVLPGIDGLIHITQLTDGFVSKPQDVLTAGQQVDAKIVDIDFEKKRVSLSIRALLEPKAPDEGEEEPAAENEIIATSETAAPPFSAVGADGNPPEADTAEPVETREPTIEV